MDVPAVIRRRPAELGVEQRDLATAAQATESYISQLLTRKKAPPAPNRTDIYDKMEPFLGLPNGELSKLADLQRQEALHRQLRHPLTPLFQDVRALILRKCPPDNEPHIRPIFEKQPFGELERLVTQKLLEVVQRVAQEELAHESWLRQVAQLSEQSYEQMQVMVLEFLDTDIFNLSAEHCVAFLDPLIESWDIDLVTFGMEIVLNRRLNSEPVKTFAFVERAPEEPVDEEPGLTAPPVMLDCAEEILAQTQALQAFTSDDAQTRRAETATVLHHTLSLFAQGPNEVPIEAFLDTFDEQTEWANALPTPVPDCAEQIQVHTNGLSNLDSMDDPNQVRESVISTLGNALSVFAQGPNEQPVQTLLGMVQQTIERANALPPPWPDYSTLLQPHIDTLEALVHSHDSEAMDESETPVLCRALSMFAQGPNAEPIQALLAAAEQLNKEKEIGTVLPDETHSLQPHIEALTALKDLDDPEALTAAAALTLYEALNGMAQGPHEAPIRALLDTFDQVTGADS